MCLINFQASNATLVYLVSLVTLQLGETMPVNRVHVQIVPLEKISRLLAYNVRTVASTALAKLAIRVSGVKNVLMGILEIL